MILHVYEVEHFSQRTVLYFMSTKWKRLTGELRDISSNEVEKFNWRDLLYFMPTNWKCLTGELYDIPCLRSRES